MQHQEKKYLVETFSEVLYILTHKKAKKNTSVVSQHYYGEHDSNDVEKFAIYDNRCEVHVLKEQNGRFTLVENRPITDKNTGVAWLKSRGYTTANIITMAYTNYVYKGGVIGLYIIDDFLHSVILDFPPDQIPLMEREFNLQKQTIITLPFNKYLASLGKLRSISL